MNIVALPSSAALSVPEALRRLAEQIEAGDLGDAHSLAWVVDCGDGRIEIGLMGHCAELAPTLHYLLALGQRKVEGAAG